VSDPAMTTDQSIKPLQIIFAGTAEFAVPILQDLIDSPHVVVCAVYTQADKRAGRGLKMHEGPVKTLARKSNLPVMQPVSFRDENELMRLKFYSPDVIVVVGYGMLLPKTVLAIPKYGCINVHPSLLPRWRGATPIQHAILANDNMTGVSVIQLNELMDAGNLLKQVTCKMIPRVTAGMLGQKLAELGSQALLEVLQALPKNGLVSTPQSDEGVTYVHKIKKEDALIHWEQSAEKIDCLIRAFNPVPGAYLYCRGVRVKIWQAERLGEKNLSTPGTIVRTKPTGIDIATRDELLRIVELQLPGGKRLGVADIFNSKRDFFSPGTLCNNWK